MADAATGGAAAMRAAWRSGDVCGNEPRCNGRALHGTRRRAGPHRTPLGEGSQERGVRRRTRGSAIRYAGATPSYASEMARGVPTPPAPGRG